MRTGIDELLHAITTIEADLQAEAEKVCTAFNEERTSRRDEEQAKQERENEGKPKARKVSFYAPLILHQRMHRGTLEITWTEMHYPKGKDGNSRGPRFRYIQKSNATEYSLRDLKSRARFFEVELVEQAERQAREVRSTWSELADIRRRTRRLAERLRQHGPSSEPSSQDLRKSDLVEAPEDGKTWVESSSP